MSFIAAALKPRSVLIATDFSEASNTALRHALAIARFYESKFCFAHVVSSLGLTLAGPSAIAACEEAACRETAEVKESLIRTGALAGIQHKFIVRRGELWPELREIIHQEDIDLIVVGTHGRHGISKLFFGSVAEEIFLKANCPVLIFGPNSHSRPWIGASSGTRIFLFPTNLGPVSDHVLPHAVAVANHFGAKLEFLSVIPDVPPTQGRDIDEGLPRLEDDARLTALRAMSELANRTALGLRPEFQVEFESKKQVSEWILDTVERLPADLIIMGQGCSTYTGLKARLGSALVYDVACQASSPVLIVSYPSEQAHLRSRVTEITSPPPSKADLIPIHALASAVVETYPRSSASKKTAR